MTSTGAVATNIEKTPKTRIGPALLLGYLALYPITLLAMQRPGNFDVAEPLLVFVIVGIGFSLAAWLLTIGVQPLSYSIRQPRDELTVISIYLLPVMAFITWGLGAIHRYIPADPADAFTILTTKLLVFVVVPAAMMHALFGYSFHQLAPTSTQPRQTLVMVTMSALLLGFQAVLGGGMRDILNAHVSVWKLLAGVPLVFVWLALEAGVVEEFFFRVLLQARLSAVLRSELGGIVLMALLFGLAHAPGLYLRTGITHEGLAAHPSFLMAVGYSIVVTSVAGFFLGVLWARTRNFALVVVVHAGGDLLPNFLPTLHSLGVLK